MGFLKQLIAFVMSLFGVRSKAPLLGSPHAGSASPRLGAHDDAHDDDSDDEPAVAPGHATIDTAGFDVERDEEGYFRALLYLDSDGLMVAPGVTITDADRAEIMARAGIRDREHWKIVRPSCDEMLRRKYGSHDAAMQRYMNWSGTYTQTLMQKTTAQKAKSGELGPVSGVTLEQWAAMNAAIAQGSSVDDMLKGQGIDRARWDHASAAWESRMANDTTFTIAQVYGKAFQEASQGKYAAHAKESAAARAAGRDLAIAPPISLERYWELVVEQAFASKLGKDPVAALAVNDLSIVDWCDLSAFMGYYIQRTVIKNDYNTFVDIQKRTEAKMAARYPNTKVDLDIAF